MARIKKRLSSRGPGQVVPNGEKSRRLIRRRLNQPTDALHLRHFGVAADAYYESASWHVDFIALNQISRFLESNRDSIRGLQHFA
jgi:hypothetical protein